jgi:hypothetical protein
MGDSNAVGTLYVSVTGLLEVTDTIPHLPQPTDEKI